MLELNNRPRTIRVTMRGEDGTVRNVAQIRKDNLEFQGDVTEEIDDGSRAELDSITEALRQRQKLHRESVLIRLMETLSEAMQYYAEHEDEMERRLIRHFVDNALRQARKFDRR
jgi:hypothetical protein